MTTKKNLLAIGLILTISPCFSQSDEILVKCKSLPKGATVVTISTPDSVNVAFKKIASLILDYGFTIANSDKELYYLNTDFASIGGYSFETKINVRLKPLNSGGTSILLKGEADSGFIFQACNYQRKDVPSRAFAHMIAVATLYENGEISATTEKK